MASDATVFTDTALLRGFVGAPMDLAVQKSLPKLDRLCRKFIADSPFLCLGTADRHGTADVSPRGDPPGFVQVLDDTTILIPERPGNRRVDSLANIVENPNVGILFFVPGIEETLRLNGRASVIRDSALLAGLAVNGKAPKLAIRVEVQEVFLHCAKALKRSKLWDPARHRSRKDFPSIGRAILEQTRSNAYDADEVDRLVEDDYKNNLY
ncbi:MAG: pyridoxamine 5'-phosphate oxidase family protein [Alphaproteobacteria bacterium]|nr:pyridoxamine 5'-phosphate oxidase family protein [Alphaproteobacteria bacterium]